MATQIDNDARVPAIRQSGYSRPGVARTSTGRVYVGHYNDSNQLEIHYSDDNGQTWTLDTTFTESNIDYLSLAISENDDVFVGFCEGTSNPTNIVVKKKDGSTGVWSEVLSEAVASISQQPILLFNKGNNCLYVFWALPGVGISNKYTTDKGATWSAVTDWADTSPSFLLDGDIRPTDNLLAVLFCSNATNYTYVYLFNLDGTYNSRIHYNTVVSDYGGAFGFLSDGSFFVVKSYYGGLRVIKNLNTSISTDPTGAIRAGHVALGVDNDDNVYIFYTKDSDEKCYYLKYNADTATWGPVTALTVGDGLRPACEKHPIPLSTDLHITYFSD